ncbi:hypothetical protein AB0D33_38065 [Streptomyces sp. NPDC048404]|uniref:hypothetical protein n=1 Tax=unclassified Streptomyces TaxID=2593676 RepID=UPI00341DAF81
MNDNQVSRTAQAITGALAARRHLARTNVIARQLDEIAPGTVRVRIVPVWTDRNGSPRKRTWVVLDSATGPARADRDQHRAALGLITRMHPKADWTRPHMYDARTGELTLDAPCAPAELGIEAA